jgi:hypothetical protein
LAGGRKNSITSEGAGDSNQYLFCVKVKEIYFKKADFTSMPKVQYCPYAGILWRLYRIQAIL